MTLKFIVNCTQNDAITSTNDLQAFQLYLKFDYIETVNYEKNMSASNKFG